MFGFCLCYEHTHVGMHVPMHTHAEARGSPSNPLVSCTCWYCSWNDLLWLWWLSQIQYKETHLSFLLFSSLCLLFISDTGTCPESQPGHWMLSLVDTLAFSPVANLVLCYISIFCLSLFFCLAPSCQGGHSTCDHPSVQLTCCCKHSLHVFSPCLLFSLPRSFSCLLGDCAHLDSGRAISSGSLPLATGKLLTV